jgi:hypothetical protein
MFEDTFFKVASNTLDWKISKIGVDSSKNNEV